MEDYMIIQKEKHELYEETYKLAKQIYNKYPVGGLLHIVLDDGNLKDCYIQDCIKNIQESNSNNTDLFMRCASNMLKMTMKQRTKLYNSNIRI